MRFLGRHVDGSTYRTSKGDVVFFTIETEWGKVFLRPSDVESAETDYERNGIVFEVDDALLAFRRGVGPDPTIPEGQRPE